MSEQRTEFARPDRRALAVAKTILWATKPLNRVTLWAARVVTTDRLADFEDSRFRPAAPSEGGES